MLLFAKTGGYLEIISRILDLGSWIWRSHDVQSQVVPDLEKSGAGTAGCSRTTAAFKSYSVQRLPATVVATPGTVFYIPYYLSRHDHETFFPLPLLVSKVSSGCFKVSRGERP